LVAARRDGSAGIVFASAASLSDALSAVISSRALAASSAMSMSMSANPPVRSTRSGSRAAATLDSMPHKSSSIVAISSVV
jgi:hypothetical protein